MDQMFIDLVGKPDLNRPKMITIVAENFSLMEDEARFVKALLAIPDLKKLTSCGAGERLIQFGSLHDEVLKQMEEEKWAVNHIDDFDESITSRIESDLAEDVKGREILFFNDVSHLEATCKDPEEPRRLLMLCDRYMRKLGHFIVMIYQNPLENAKSELLRDLEFLSHGFAHVKLCKDLYFMKLWHQQVPEPKTKTHMQSKVETRHYTCRIGKSYWSPDLPCFHDLKEVACDFDIQDPTKLALGEVPVESRYFGPGGSKEKESSAWSYEKYQDDDDDEADREAAKLSTMPHLRAQNPEKTRIFYYPDKQDDMDDEDEDPDADLNI